jgi:hypothetical protein
MGNIAFIVVNAIVLEIKNYANHKHMSVKDVVKHFIKKQ